MQITSRIHIPRRNQALETELFVMIITENEKNLYSKPFLMMLPGGPGANHSNYLSYAALQSHCNVVLHDPRGCGLSRRTNPSDYTMVNYIDDIEVIRHTLNLPHIFLLGKSYGAMCALAYTLKYPRSLQKLILAAGAPSYRFIDTAKANFLSRKPTLQQQELCQKLWQGTFATDEEVMTYLQVMAPFYSYRVRQGQLSNRPSAAYPHAHEVLNQGFRNDLYGFDFESQLHQIKCPTLILAGEEDWVTDKKYSELMAQKIAHSQLILFPNADHAMEVDVPEAYFAAIQTFLRN